MFWWLAGARKWPWCLSVVVVAVWVGDAGRGTRAAQLWLTSILERSLCCCSSLVLLVVSLVLLVVARVLPSEIVNSCDAVLRISHVAASAACLMTVSVH